MPNKTVPESGSPQTNLRQKPPLRTIVITLTCILAVLVLINVDKLLEPFRILWSILAPVTIGLVIAYLCNPFLRFYEHKIFVKIKSRRINMVFSMLCAYATLLAILAGIVWLILPRVVVSINDLLYNGKGYIETLLKYINQFIALFPFAKGEDGEPIDVVTFERVFTYLMNWLSAYGASLLEKIGNLAGGLLTTLKNILVGIFISIYLLLSKDRLNATCRRLFRAVLSKKQESSLLHYIGTAHKKFGGFLIGKIFDSAIVGLVSGILFSVFQIPYPVLVAVIIGVTDVIPFFGPFIGAIPSALLIFIVSPSKALLFVILILVVQQIDGNLLAPWILGDRTGLSSLGVLFAVTVMGNLMGISGMIIGVPLFALLMAIFDDYIGYRLKAKSASPDLYDYYPADAFIRPEDERRDDDTMTKRFVRWVRGVQDVTEEELSSTRLHVSFYFRKGCYAIGHFFHMLFSIHPIPEDEKGAIHNRIIKEGMKEDRGFWHVSLLSLISAFAYPIYLVEVTAQATNIACQKDGKRTWGAIPYLLLSLFSLSFFFYFWHCLVIDRWQNYAEQRGKSFPLTKKKFLLLALLGLPTIVLPIVALALFTRGMNEMAKIYNKEHGFKSKKKRRAR